MHFLRYVGLAVTTSAIAIAGCDSSDDDNNPTSGGGFTGGGTAGTAGGGTGGASGGQAGSGGSSASGGDGGSSASGGSGGSSASGGSGGSSASGGSGGSAAAAGSGGSSASGGSGGSGCPADKAECDNNPATVCETDLTLLTSCGSCTNACNGANGTVECQTQDCVMTSCNTGFGNCDPVANDGCETNLVNNDSHCGSCDRDCAAAGSTCDTDQCAPITVYSPLPVSSDNSNGWTWAFGNNSIYHVGYFGYSVRQFPLDGSGVVTRYTPPSPAAAGRQSLLANDNEVIWVQRGSTSVVLKKAHTAAETDIPEVVFTPAYQPYHLTIQGTAYYWFSGDYQSGDPVAHIYTRSVTAPSSDPGTAIMTVDQGNHGSVVAFATSTDALYWYTLQGSADEVRTVPLSGGTPTVVPTGDIVGTFNRYNVKLRTVGNTLYYNHDVDTAFTNGIYRWTPGDTSPTQVVVAEDVHDFVVDDDAIYYLAGGQAKTFRVPLTGGTPTEIADVGGSLFVHQDATSVYTVRVSSTPGNNRMYRILK